MADEPKAERPRYRRISIRVWRDEKFLALSAPKPNARDLWIWLIVGPLTTPVPGVVLASLPVMADRIGWPLAATRRCWDEIAQLGMASADWAHGLIWLPQAVRHNAPESPNVVKAWRSFLEEQVAECPFRAELEAQLARYLTEHKGQAFREAFGRPYGEAFREAFAEGPALPFGESGIRNQDQESGHSPQPPVAGATEGRLIRPTRREMKHAEDLRRSWGRCPHNPPCESYGECLGVFVAHHRRNVKAGLRAAAS